VTRRFPVTVAAYSDAMVEEIAGPVARRLRSGDEVDLVIGNRDRPLDLATLDRWTSRLSASLPSEVTLLGHTSGLAKAFRLAREAPPAVRAVVLDYEPEYDPEFTWEFGPTRDHFERFAAGVRTTGRRAIGYPTGRPLREGPLQRFGWDYGELASKVDDLYPQTQHWARLGPEAWHAVLERLRSQLGRPGLGLPGGTVQVTLGDSVNAIAGDAAFERIREAEVGGPHRLFVWWSPSHGDELSKLLARLDE